MYKCSNSRKKNPTCHPGHKPRKKNQLTMAISCTMILTLLALCLPIGGVKGNFGSPVVDGSKDANYSLIVNGSLVNKSFNVYQMNNEEYYWFYLESLGNITFNEFYMNRSGLELNISQNTNLTGLFEFVFSPARLALEFKLDSNFVPGTLDFQLNHDMNESHSFPIIAFPEPIAPEEPEDTYGYGLTEFMQGLGDLLFANGWLSVFFWVIVIIWFWRSMQRKIWILRKEGSIKGRDWGRWIKEEQISLPGATPMRLWRHKFKTDVAKTATVQYAYCQYNKEEILAKTQFKRINGFWLALPYIRLGTLKLRPDQYYREPKMVKSIGNYITRVFYYLCCWIPKLNDEIYNWIQWEDSNTIVKSIPYLYINYAEDRIIEMIETQFEEKIFDEINQVEVWTSRSEKLTKEQIVLLEKQDNVKNVRKGEKTLQIQSFNNLDEALADKFSREELMAIHRYKESLMDSKIKQLNERLESTIETLENERRARVEEVQDMLDKMAEHSDYLNQNMAHYIAKASGIKNLGVGSKDALQIVMRQALEDYLKNSDKIQRRDELLREKEFAELQEKFNQAQRDLSKKTQNDIDLGEITIEHDNNEE